jgi:hypothetical protein
LVIHFEGAFPVILIAPAEITITLLSLLWFAFHLGCAVMGLNAFLLAFPGLYASVLPERRRRTGRRGSSAVRCRSCDTGWQNARRLL